MCKDNDETNTPDEDAAGPRTLERPTISAIRRQGPPADYKKREMQTLGSPIPKDAISNPFQYVL